MDNTNCTTERQKNKHLNYDERMLIQIRLKDGHSPYKIAKELGCASNTVRNEMRRGTVEQIKQGKKINVYIADSGQNQYEKHRRNSVKKYSRLLCWDFIAYVVDKMKSEDWSPDACFGNAVLNRLFKRSEMVCTKTIYNYIDMELLAIKNMDLPMKLRRNTKQKRVRQNKKKLGRSIEERCESINNREEFGDWEIDTVIGSKTKGDEVLMTIAERKTRHFIIRKIADKTAPSVMEAIKSIQEEFGDSFDKVFKTITSDNGSEFAELAALEKECATMIYFTHPYTSCEKGTNERHNGLIRRFIPKGHRIDEYTADEVEFVEEWCNNLPRKILGYHTPYELFEKYLDAIYAA